jgi:hypothetical protein
VGRAAACVVDAELDLAKTATLGDDGDRDLGLRTLDRHRDDALGYVAIDTRGGGDVPVDGLGVLEALGDLLEERIDR